MAYVIGATCEKCEECVDACPTEAIHPTKDEGDFEDAKQLFIDPDTCADCAVCVEACPTDAIFAEDELPEDQTDFAQKAVDFYANRA